MKNHKTRLKINRNLSFSVIVLIFTFFLLGLVHSVNAHGASLYLSPSGGNYTVGSTFSVEVKVNSGGQSINAAEGNLIFNSNEISVVSISKGGSIFNLWTNEPAFSNPDESITFGGGTSSGFNGNTGTIITITFKAKASSSARVDFLAGSVLAADGKGTNILGSMSGGMYNLNPKVVTPPAEEVSPEAEYPSPTSGVPAAPVLSSSTHPDLDKWYSNSSPEFFWKLPSDVTAVRLSTGHNPTDLPTEIYTPPISGKKLENLTDGVWYFHIRFKNGYGWGGVVHRKILIDTEVPEPFEINSDNEGDATNPNPILSFKSEDLLSGIEFYEVIIDGEQTAKIASEEIDNSYRVPLQSPGRHIIIVKAFDKVGNCTETSTDLIIEPIEAPEITDFPQRIKERDNLIIKGHSLYPWGEISVFIKKEGEEASVNNVEADSEGNWLYIHPDSLNEGVYQVWAQVTDSRGAKSNLTEKVTIEVSLPALIKFGKIAIDYLSVIVSLTALIIVLVGIIFYGWFRIYKIRNRLRKETKEAERSVSKAFKVLREKIEEEIEYFDKKPGLTKREKEVRDKLVEALDISKEFIKKEIKDVKKELE